MPRNYLQKTAQGVDPTTGEVLPDDSVCNKGEIVRAFYAVLNRLEEKRPKKNLPANAGKPWSTEEDAKLIDAFKAGMSKKELCTMFERSSGSIASRLARLGLSKD